MDTKSNGWTTRSGVKIISFILIIALCFVMLNRIFASVIRVQETGVSPQIVLVDISTNQYFLEQHMGLAHHHASILAYYGSEELILSGAHLEWTEHENSYRAWHDGYFAEGDNVFPDYYDDGIGVYLPEGYYVEGYYETTYEYWSQLSTPDGNFQYADYERAVPLSPQQREKYEQSAIAQQLGEFRAAQDYLDNTEGLLYYINIENSSFPSGDTSTILTKLLELIEEQVDSKVLSGILSALGLTGSPSDETVPDITTHSNVTENNQTAAFFKSQPVYLILSGDGREEKSFEIGYSFYMPYDRWGSVIYIAFAPYVVNAWNDTYIAARDAYVLDLSIIASCVVLILGLTVVLLVGAGRKSKANAGEAGCAGKVHFNALDKPYLDIGLVLLICWTVLAVFSAFRVTNAIWFHKNITAMNLLLAVAILLTVPPVLSWLISFTKRVKAGQFWKHTLIYAILYKVLYGLLRFCVRSAKELWAGARLTGKVALIAVISFCMMFFIGVFSYGFSYYGPIPAFLLSLAFTAAVAFFLLRYAKRINTLDLGARAASEGNYGTLIDAGEGELGSVANSINNISAGINAAVEQRMKSERLKTELITNVSHDIRTPLTSIITYTDLLKHEGLDCEKAPEYLDVLIQKSQRLKTLTDELFEASKAATGNIEVNLTELDIVSLINQVLGELDGAIKASGLDLRTRLPERLPVMADGRLMWRVLENLLSNVFKYSLPGSRVYLDALQVDSSNIQIDIKNISSAELNFDPSELTERFKRGDDSRADGGSGLGLSIVQSFMSAQGGRFAISIDGDLFKATVTLPCVSGEQTHLLKD